MAREAFRRTCSKATLKNDHFELFDYGPRAAKGDSLLVTLRTVARLNGLTTPTCHNAKLRKMLDIPEGNIAATSDIIDRLGNAFGLFIQVIVGVEVIAESANVAAIPCRVLLSDNHYTYIKASFHAVSTCPSTGAFIHSDGFSLRPACHPQCEIAHNSCLRRRSSCIHGSRVDNCVCCPEGRSIAIMAACRNRIRTAGLLKDSPRGHYRTLLGCNAETLITHIEKQFTDGMTWEGYGNAWQMDHIIAIKTAPGANGGKPDKAEMEARCHFTNIQPLFVADHAKKTAEETKGRRTLTLPTQVAVVKVVRTLELTDAEVEELIDALWT